MKNFIQFAKKIFHFFFLLYKIILEVKQDGYYIDRLNILLKDMHHYLKTIMNTKELWYDKEG